MRTAHHVATVRVAEAALMATVPDGALMQRAAAGLAARCADLLRAGTGAVVGRRVALLVGAGDNGGDALFAGARLARRGAAVTAVLVADRAHAGGLAALRAAGGRVLTAVGGEADLAAATAALTGAHLLLDGVVGIGGHGGLRDPAAGLVAAVDAVRARDVAPCVVAVDLPSGVDADTGDVPGAAVTADVTVTFGTYKPGLLVRPGHDRVGALALVDIGLDAWLPTAAALQVPDLVDVAGWWPWPGPADDKYTRGVVGVVAGSTGYPGAAVLCTGGALRAGAGMVRFLGDEREAVTRAWPEAVMTEGQVQAWVVGPGLGLSDAAAARVADVMARPEPVLVDADALTHLAARPDLVARRRAVTVVTPHDREYERLAGRPVGGDRVGAAVDLARRWGMTVLLKGATTVVAGPDGPPWVVLTGVPRLATAGSGDVLSGVTGALLAAGLGERAPVAAAFVHGLAGRLAALPGAPVLAADVLAAVPRAVAALAGSAP